MTEFKLALHDQTGDPIVEIWVNGKFRAVLYPIEGGVKLMSNHLKDLGDELHAWEFDLGD